MGRFAPWMVAVIAICALVAGPAILFLARADVEDDGVFVEQGPAAARAYAAAVGARAPAEAPAAPRPRVKVPDVPPRTSRAPAPGPVEALTYLLEDASGEPAAGVDAVLSLLPGDLAGRAYRPATAMLPDHAFFPEGDARWRATSGEFGELRFEGVPWDRRIRIDVPAQDGRAAACLLDTTSYVRRKTIRLHPAGHALQLAVAGLPPHHGTACVLVGPVRSRDLGTAAISQHWIHCVLPLDENGRCVTPPIPAGPLRADVWVPGVGMWRHLAVQRTGGEAARVLVSPVPTATVRGRLLDAEGHGVPDAQLALSVTGYLSSKARPRWLLPAASDAQGRFRFEQVPAGLIDELFVDVPGFVAPRLVLEKAPLRPGDDLEVAVQLVPGCAAVGRLLQPDGTPIAGARVRVAAGNARMCLWSPGSVWTDAKGRWFVDGLPPGSCTVTFSLPGSSRRAEVKGEIRRSGPTRVADAVLPEVSVGGQVAVLVVGPDGKPQVGARVAYRLRQGNVSGRGEAGVTGRDGRYVLEDLQTDLDTFEVWAYRQGAVSKAYPVKPAEIAARSASVRVELPPVGRIRGRVLCDGEPAADVTVIVAGTRLRATTDHAGAFLLKGVPPGLRELRLRAPGGSSVGTPEVVEVRAGETAEATLSFTPPPGDHVIAGRLTGPAGRGLVDVVVSAHPRDGGGAAGRASTDGEGGFRIAVPRAGLYELRSGTRVLRRDVPADEGPINAVFDAGAIHVVQGRVVTSDGRPAAGGEVTVSQDGQGREPDVHAGGGVFRMELKPGQTAGLTLEMSFGCLDRWGRTVTGEAQKVPFEPDASVVVRGPSPAAAARRKKPTPPLVGIVVGPQGQPLAGATLWVVEGNKQSGGPTSGKDGTFAFGGVPAGPFLLQVDGPAGYRSMRTPRRVRVRDGPVRVTLPALAASEMYTVTITLVDRDGKPVPGLLVTLDAFGTRASAKSDARGRVLFPRFPRDSRRTIHVSVGGGGIEKKVEGYEGNLDHASRFLEPGQEAATLHLALRKRHPEDEHDVRIHVVDPKGAILPEGWPRISLRGVGEYKDRHYDVRRHPWSRKEPRIRIADVPAGRYRVQVGWNAFDPPYLPVRPFEIDVPCPPVELPLTRAAVLSGVVDDDVGSGASATLLTEEGTRWMRRPLSKEGRFSFNVDPNEAITLFVRCDGKDEYALLEDVHAADSPLHVVLDKEGLSVRGRVAGLKRVPKKYGLTVSGPYGNLAAVLGKDGRFAVRGLPAGTYSVAFETTDLDALEHPPEGIFANAARRDVPAGSDEIVLRIRRER